MIYRVMANKQVVQCWRCIGRRLMYTIVSSCMQLMQVLCGTRDSEHEDRDQAGVEYISRNYSDAG